MPAETVRIILKNMMIGLKKAVVLKWYHPDAADYYDACNKLEQVLDELTDSKKRRVQEMKLFQIFTPMLAKKDKELKVQKIFPNKQERAAAGGGGRSKPLGNPFVVQPKYDGERIILHWDATACGGHGELALYTRNANIYTEKYGNALKPWLREHVKADKVILDGEMLTWDSTLHRFGQFGNNNGVMLEQQLTKHMVLRMANNNKVSECQQQTPHLRSIYIYIIYIYIYTYVYICLCMNICV